MKSISPWICEVSELATVTNGQMLSAPVATFSRVGTNSREDLTGRLFIPLKGEKFDAHDFVAQAIERGAQTVLVGQWREEWRPLLSRAAFVQVADTLKALQEFGRHWRRRQGFKVLGITGSNGKTSTKEFTYALLKPHVRVHASKGSFNNHWGVPLSILEASSEHTHLILEMGMNHSGEIYKLCQIAEPDVVVVTTVGRAHLGELGSVEAIAAAKEEIYQAAPQAWHIFNGDNEWTIRMQTRSTSKQMVFSSFNSQVDVHLRAHKVTWQGLDLVGHLRGVEGRAVVGVLGRHNTVNLMAAGCLALASGLTPEQIWNGFGQIRDVAWGRNQVMQLDGGARVLFDGYNANPDSMIALLTNLFEMEVPGRKMLIAGDMFEQGEFTERVHEEIGERAGAVGLDTVWYVGQNAKAFRRGLEKSGAPNLFLSSETVDSKVADQVRQRLKEGDLLAVKGSRGMALERVFEGWSLNPPLGKKP